MRHLLLTIAQKILEKYDRGFLGHFFKTQKIGPDYTLHRVLGALEFVAKLPSPAKTDPRKEVLSAALQPLDSSIGPRINELIASVGKLRDDNLKKPLLQIIARSGWAGERNSNLLVRMMIYVNLFLRQELKDIVAIGKVVFQIDNLLKQEDLNLLGGQIGNILTVDRDLIILGRVKPSDKIGDPIDEAIAMEFDLLVVDYFRQNNLGTEYLKDFSGIIASQAGLESIKTKLIVLAKNAIKNNTGNRHGVFGFHSGNKQTLPIDYGLHRALGAIEFCAKLIRPTSLNLAILQTVLNPSQSRTNRNMNALIKKIGTVTDEDLKKALLQLVARAAWAGDKETEIATNMIKFIDERILSGVPEGLAQSLAKTQVLVGQIDALIDSADVTTSQKLGEKMNALFKQPKRALQHVKDRIKGLLSAKVFGETAAA